MQRSQWSLAHYKQKIKNKEINEMKFLLLPCNWEEGSVEKITRYCEMEILYLHDSAQIRYIALLLQVCEPEGKHWS